jgi:hypothetical protein
MARSPFQTTFRWRFNLGNVIFISFMLGFIAGCFIMRVAF